MWKYLLTLTGFPKQPLTGGWGGTASGCCVPPLCQPQLYRAPRGTFQNSYCPRRDSVDSKRIKGMRGESLIEGGFDFSPSMSFILYVSPVSLRLVSHNKKDSERGIKTFE